MSRLSEPTKQAIEKLFSEYKLKRARAALLMARLTGAGGSILEWRPKGESTYEEVLVNLADLQKEIELIEIALSALTERERRFVILRYFDGLSHPAVARRLGLSERSTYRLRDRALIKVAAVLSGRNLSVDLAEGI